MEVWVQRSLFDEAGLQKLTKIALTPNSRDSVPRRSLRVDRSRVTRDPAVAASHANSTQTASDFRLGLARALAELTPEQRAAILAPLNRGGSRSAA